MLNAKNAIINQKVNGTLQFIQDVKKLEDIQELQMVIFYMEKIQIGFIVIVNNVGFKIFNN